MLGWLASLAPPCAPDIANVLPGKWRWFSFSLSLSSFSLPRKLFVAFPPVMSGGGTRFHFIRDFGRSGKLTLEGGTLSLVHFFHIFFRFFSVTHPTKFGPWSWMTLFLKRFNYLLIINYYYYFLLFFIFFLGVPFAFLKNETRVSTYYFTTARTELLTNFEWQSFFLFFSFLFFCLSFLNFFLTKEKEKYYYYLSTCIELGSS